MCTRTGRLLAALALSAAGATAGAAPPGAGIALAPCQLSPSGSAAQRVSARCGVFEVPEVWPAPGAPAGGRTLALRVAVVEAEGGVARDAVFMLAGGPGQAATEVFPILAPAFERLKRKRDIVLVDQRGTGGSGKLECPEVPQPVVGRPMPPEEQRSVVEACHATLAKQADLDAYRTEAFVRDLDAVRAALGYDRVNLVGFSYGTRAAQVYLRTFPDRVRTMVLDGVAPMQMTVGSAFEEDAQVAVDQALARCQAEPGCKARFPALEQELEALFARLSSSPATVPVRDALTGAPRTMTLGADELRQVLFAFSYAPESAALLPPLLHAAAGGDLVPLAGALQIVAGDLEASITRPLQFSVLCAEDIPFYPPPPAAGRRWFGSMVRDQFQRVCSAWKVKPVDASFRAPFRSNVPALLLSGEADPVTPPRWAELALKDFPQGRHVVLPGLAHGVFFRGCLPRVAAAFVEAGTADGLDTGCVERVRAAPPFLDGQGGSP